MNLSEVKTILQQAKQIAFKLPNGDYVPKHFHVTEVGRIQKHFIDCGGTIRSEERINFQLWNADDCDHRLHPDKLLKIIRISEEKLSIGNHEIEVEYQGETISKFGLDFDGTDFLLTTTHTDCLAKESCGIPEEKEEISACCPPNSGCC